MDVRDYIGAGEGGGKMYRRIEIALAIRYPN